MKISIFGLGYVGVISSACLAHEGHEIVGVDVSPEKIDMVNSGRSPVIEDKVDELLAQAVAAGKLRAVRDAASAIEATDLAIVCVGTPSLPDGSLDQRAVVQVAREIGAALRARKRPFHLVMRSTMLPGTMRDAVIPALEQASGRPAGEGYEVSYHPEFLREGAAVNDFESPPKIVVGERAPGTGAPVMGLYGAKFTCPRITCALEEAEMVKYCDNLFHAVKITFANEIGLFCRTHGVDSVKVMGYFCQDTKLNISPKYLGPGFAFGGSCLPKDLRAFLRAAHERGLEPGMLAGILPSNTRQIESAAERALTLGQRNIGIHGLAFKQGTDDLRHSPHVELVERLLGKGSRMRIYDENVRVARLLGGNKSYIEQKLPHLAELLVEKPEELDGCAAIVICHPAPPETVRRWLGLGRKVFDLTGRRDIAAQQGYESVV